VKTLIDICRELPKSTSAVLSKELAISDYFGRYWFSTVGNDWDNDAALSQYWRNL